MPCKMTWAVSPPTHQRRRQWSMLKGKRLKIRTSLVRTTPGTTSLARLGQRTSTYPSTILFTPLSVVSVRPLFTRHSRHPALKRTEPSLLPLCCPPLVSTTCSNDLMALLDPLGRECISLSSYGILSKLTQFARSGILSGAQSLHSLAPFRSWWPYVEMRRTSAQATK